MMQNDGKQGKQPLDKELVQKLFQMQPDNRLTPAQMVRRSLFPRWEVITPAEHQPVQEEDRRIAEILSATLPETQSKPAKHPDA